MTKKTTVGAVAKDYSTGASLAPQHREKSSPTATNTLKTSWRNELARLEPLDLPLVATGAESRQSPGEKKAPADLRTGRLLVGWQTAKHSVEDIKNACDAVISVGTRTGADAHGLLVFDIDGETALDWLAARGLDPAAVSTWQIHRDTDPKRLKVAFQLTEQQQQELGQIKTKVVTKRGVKDDAGKVIAKGEAVELFHGIGQVIILGQHYKSKGNYFWPVDMGPENLAGIPENWWQAALTIAENPTTTTRSPSDKRSRKSWNSLSDCPICGRNTSEYCAQHRDGKTIRCFHGNTFAPPTGLKTGDLHTDRQGTIWAYSKTKPQSNGDVFSTFIEPEPDPDFYKQLFGSTSKALVSISGSEDEPSRSEAQKLCYTELLEQALLAIRAGDVDTEMALRAEIIGRFKRNDTQITAALFRLLAEQETGKPASNTKKAESLDLYSIDGLDALLDGFIPANDLGLMFGAKGSGKTLAALAMAFATIDGTGFLDHTKPAQQGPVLFIASDSGAPPLMAAMQDLGVADHPATRGEDRSFHLWAHNPSQGMGSWCASINGCVELLQFVKAKGIKLVLIDSAKTICAKAGISYLDNDSIAALLTFIKEAICVHASVMILSHDGTEKGSHSGAKVWAEVPSIVHNIQQVPDAPDERLWRVVKNRMGSLRQLRYQVGEDGGLEVCAGVETIGDATAAVIQVLSEAAVKGINSLSRGGLVQEIGRRFRLAPKTVDNTLTRLVRAVKPEVCRVANKRGHYKLSPRVLADISSDSSTGISPKGKEEGKNLVSESDLVTSRGGGSGNSTGTDIDPPPSSRGKEAGKSLNTSEGKGSALFPSQNIEIPIGERALDEASPSASPPSGGAEEEAKKEAPLLLPAAELVEVSRNSDSVIPAAFQVIEVQPLPLPPSSLSPRSGGNPVEAIPEENVKDREAPSSSKPKTPWVPLPPEGNSQLEWLSHWPEFFED